MLSSSIDHRVSMQVTDGSAMSMALVARSVADFYAEFMDNLESLGIQVKINTHPVEVDDGIPFEEDRQHADYDPVSVNRWWRILVGVTRLLEEYRGGFVGKSSPVQFWRGSFDLSTARFSGRPAPPREWPAHWMALGAGQEEHLSGFWPSNNRLPDPAFVAYTYPEPPGCCPVARVKPDAAYFHPDLAEFVLPYENLRLATDWDRAALERSNSG